MRTVLGFEPVDAPGGYGDGAAYIRVHLDTVRRLGRRVHYRREDMPPFTDDAEHDYVWAENSHNAFVRLRWLIADGAPAAALAVVRPALPSHAEV